MAELWLHTIKYFGLAIREFSVPLRLLRDKAQDAETQERLNNLIELYSETATKIDRFRLDFTDPNKNFPGEPLDIEIDLDDKEKEHFVRLTLKMFEGWKERIRKLEAAEFITSKNKEELLRLKELVWPLEAGFNNQSGLLFKLKGKGPIIFPGEKDGSSGDLDSRPRIDFELRKIGPHLVEIRKGMWAALEKNSSDSARQAAHSARELIDQVLKEGAPKGLATRKERAIYIIKQHRATASAADVDIIDANAKLIAAEDDKLIKLAHGRFSPTQAEVRRSVEAAERIMQLLFDSA